jgi:hypothetical protein
MIVPPVKPKRQVRLLEGHAMLKLECDLCHQELKEPGALIFSPPTSEAWIVEKYHVCADCWPAIVALLKK